MKYTIRPTCGHVALGYNSLRLARAHARAHATRCGAPIHITRTNDATGYPVHVDTIQACTYGPFIPCQPTSSTDPMWEHACKGGA